MKNLRLVGETLRYRTEGLQPSVRATKKLEIVSPRGGASITGVDEAISDPAWRLRANMVRTPLRFVRNDKLQSFFPTERCFSTVETLRVTNLHSSLTSQYAEVEVSMDETKEFSVLRKEVAAYRQEEGEEGVQCAGLHDERPGGRPAAE